MYGESESVHILIKKLKFHFSALKKGKTFFRDNEKQKFRQLE